MNVTASSGQYLRFLIGLACFVVVSAGIQAAAQILVPFLLSVFIAFSCTPLLTWLQKRGLPTGVAVILIMVVISTGVLIVISFVSSSISEFTRRLPGYQTLLVERFSTYLLVFEKFGLNISDEVVLEYFDPRAIMRLAGAALLRLRGILTNTFFILLTVVFILLEASSFPRKLAAISGGPEGVSRKYEEIAAKIKRYLAIKSGTSLATGALIALLLYVLEVDFPVLWGLLAFLFNYVPAIGPVIAAVPALLLAIVQLEMFGVVLVALGYTVVNIAIGSIIEPRLFGREIGISTLVVFLSLVFWGYVLGPVGMLFSVPLTMIVKIAMEGSEETRWLAILLGSDKRTEIGPPAVDAPVDSGPDHRSAEDGRGDGNA
ncbi:MAG: AI-2E family transporter [Desulfobacterales bacterium]|nr:AI-2E family transporter [Desulfobacterales bacterium]